MNRKDLVIAVLATFCLTTTLFAISSKSTEPYDPWADVSGPTSGVADGTINMRDIAYEIQRFNTHGTPIDKSQVILDLQNRVSALEEKANQTKWIRFYDPTEYLSSTSPPLGTKDIVTFVWIPNNSTNNVLLSIRCYFQYYVNGTDDLNHPVNFGLKIDGRETASLSTYVVLNEFGWSRIFRDDDFRYGGNPLGGFIASFIPNNSNHTITFQLLDIGYEATAYVKDINILLEVMDGLPPS